MLINVNTKELRKGRSILITGASKGIGEAAALYFAKKDWVVFAGYRSKRDGYRIKQLGGKNLNVIKLDVTSPRHIQDAVQAISQKVGGKGLDALVNNAGIAVASPIEYLSLDELRYQFEVNLVGQVAVTQTFLPLIRKAKGRIINISSYSGRFANPFLAPYAMSKFALEAFTDSLRREVMMEGIEVVSILPGSVATPIWETSLRRFEQSWENFPPAAQKRYAKVFEKMKERISGRDTSGMDPQEIVDIIEEALTVPRPRTRYVAGRSVKIRFFLQRFMTDRFFDRMVKKVLYSDKE